LNSNGDIGRKLAEQGASILNDGFEAVYLETLVQARTKFSATSKTKKFIARRQLLATFCY
jgi:hypothetical protein